MDTDTEIELEEITLAHVEIPEGAVVAREVRLIEYRNEDGSTGMAIGVWDEITYDPIRTLGILSMGSVMLAREQAGA